MYTGSPAPGVKASPPTGWRFEVEYESPRELAEARKDADLTEAEIAALMGTTQSVVSRIESGAAATARGWGDGPAVLMTGATRLISGEVHDNMKVWLVIRPGDVSCGDAVPAQ